MTDRYRPNEPACPIPLELLSLLLRSPAERVRELTGQMQDDDRASLALYCVGRAHMRALGFRILRECSEWSAKRAGGVAGVLLHQQALEGQSSADEARSQRKPISLARVG